MILYAQLMLRICSVEILDMNYFVILLDDLDICFASASKLFQPDVKNFFRPRLNFFNPSASCNPGLAVPIGW